MNFLEIIALTLNSLICIPSIASFTKYDYWWIRGFDFPRIQIVSLIVLNIALAFYAYNFGSNWHFIILAMLCLSLLYQLVLIYPYTFFAKKQVINYAGKPNDNTISILVSNVLMTNTKYQKLIDLTLSKNPDILLTLETNKTWEDAICILEHNYQHCVKIPLENLYGMHLYSKLPLENVAVKYLISNEIPSIHGTLVLHNGMKVSFHCIHPKPPSPTESKKTTNRDAEILLTAKEIKKDLDLVLVFGDFNDVAWSRITNLFQKVSGLMDPRRGRGFFNTYNANHTFLRWPLDHVFHSDNFTLIEIAREKNIGSDHFPMYIKLNYTPSAKNSQHKLKLDADEKETANKKIKNAKK